MLIHYSYPADRSQPLPQPRCSPETAIPSLVDTAIASRRRVPRVNLARSPAICALLLVAMSSVGGIVPAAEHDARAIYTLRLEYELRDRRGIQASDGPLSPARRAGISELEGRAAAADDLVKSLEQDHQKWVAELSAREELISELEQALNSQNETIRLLESKVLQTPQPPAPSPQAGTQTWGLAGWDPGAFRWDDVRKFALSPTAAERALTVAVVLLLIHVLYLRLRVYRNLPGRDDAPRRTRVSNPTSRSAAERPTPQAQTEPRPSPEKREAVAPGPVAADTPRREPPETLGRISPRLQLDDESTLPETRPAAPQPQEPAPPTVRLAPEETLQRDPAPSAASMQQSTRSPTSSASSTRQHQRADPQTLREVDALIAFEQFDEAAELLEKAMAGNPVNPEYRLRLLYIRNALGDYERFATDQAMLQTMMDGPMSDTLGRVIKAGRDLLPDNPLFEAKDSAAEPAPSQPLSLDDPIALSDDVVDEFNDLTFRPTGAERDDEPPKND